MRQSSDYSSRFYDLLVLSGATPENDARTPITLGMSSYAISGIQALCQKYISLLLTERTTVKSDPNYGTYFITNLRASGNADKDQIEALFNSASSEAIDWLKLYDTPTHDDEKIKGVELVSTTVTYGDIKLACRLTTEADSSTILYLTPKLYL